MNDRNMSYRKFWKELIDHYGRRCFYCRVEIATTIDHVVPYSYDQDNSIENLVPACGLCNALASNKNFDSAEHKRQYILKERKHRKLTRSFCSCCLVPYAYKQHSPSLMSCPECYDEEHGTNYSETREWGRWIKELRLAGIPIEAHRRMKKRIVKAKRINLDVKLETLIDEYSKIFDSDPDFVIMIL